MGRFGPLEILIIAVVLLVLFGRGKISNLMGEVGKGITAFKKGVKDSAAEVENASSDTARDVTPSTIDKDKV
ncbi:Sec-independent protein translocase protein TatA [Gemmobacter lanyuensis]|uniref:Sec-independent protein translocase protein TatA n=1 Tax=Gemmobacter lanyuensis TaxID=1054497 RepID=A0A918IMM0_9RHOB|nr:twin-arginine translocase TatA/TatE family subunit [Gemmobacter lanyuensis]GGW22872.1 Sec-independent protein translocase protein TatA [Gemmobacter lanyuensis]